MEANDIEFTHLTAVLNDYAVTARNEYQDNLIRAGKIATGDLLNSIDYEVTKGGYTFQVQLRLADYWKYVENGRPANSKMPPFKVILKWIQDKPIYPARDKHGRIPSPNSLAYLIARKIAKRGIKPTSALGLACAKTNATFMERIQAALEKDVEGWAIKNFKAFGV